MRVLIRWNVIPDRPCPPEEIKAIASGKTTEASVEASTEQSKGKN